jgi:hypothetical protein
MAVAREPRGPRIALWTLATALVAAMLALDLPRASGGEFWGDSATYYAMAWSLARDGDLRYDAGDLARTRAEYPGGPQGVFLKRSSGGLTVDPAPGFPWLRWVRPEEGRLYYAKAIAHPVLAAPFVVLLGSRGFGVLNALLLAGALAAACAVLRRRGFAGWPALTVAGALFLLTVTPLYLVWPTPEILGLTLVTAGLACWAHGRPLLAAVLFGVAGYLKPPNVLMAAPLGLEPLLPPPGGQLLGPGWAGRLWHSVKRGLVLAATAAALYGANAAVTGELNYQGGERKTFYGRFPLDEGGATFDDSGAWMTTNQLGPLVAGKDDADVSEQSGPARKRSEFREALLLNLGYFWYGRFGGVLAYFFPALLTLLLFLLPGPRERAGWLALVAIVLSWLFYIRVIPDNWYGGGGTLGNRYFLNVLPAFLFLVPARRFKLLGAGAALGFAVFVAPIAVPPEAVTPRAERRVDSRHPFAGLVHHSLRPGDHATRGAYRLLPAELTMLNDLSVFTEPWRKKRPYGFVGNAERGADTDAFFLYFMDEGTWGREERAGRPGFWLRGDGRAEVVVRAFDLAPVESIVLRLTGGPAGDVVEARRGWHVERVRLGPGETREVELPVGRGVLYYDTFLHVVHLRSGRAGRLPDGRSAGSFVEPRLAMGRFSP